MRNFGQFCSHINISQNCVLQEMNINPDRFLRSAEYSMARTKAPGTIRAYNSKIKIFCSFLAGNDYGSYLRPDSPEKFDLAIPGNEDELIFYMQCNQYVLFLSDVILLSFFGWIIINTGR